MRSGITSGVLSFIAVLICGLSNVEKRDQPIEIDLEKNAVARTRVQSVLALGTFTAVL